MESFFDHCGARTRDHLVGFAPAASAARITKTIISEINSQKKSRTRKSPA
jgi:hypothetical protein